VFRRNTPFDIELRHGSSNARACQHAKEVMSAADARVVWHASTGLYERLRNAIVVRWKVRRIL